MYRIAISITTALALVTGPADANESVQRSDFSAQEIVKRVLAIADVVIDEHIDPPAMQQMILQGVKSLYAAHGDQRIPAGLSRRVSTLSGRDEIALYLTELCDSFPGADPELIETTFIRGLCSSVPGNCVLVEPADEKVSEQIENNRYVGMGIALTSTSENRFPQVGKVLYGGPAWRAGMKDGDSILEVDGKSLESMNINEAVETLRGDEGMGVSVVVRQPEATQTRVLTMVLGRVFIPTVTGEREMSAGRYKYTLEAAPEIALLSISSVGPSTLHELRKAASQLDGQDLAGVVLVLAGGGNPHDAVVVADGLLNKGTIGYLQTKESELVYNAREGSLFGDLPMIVIVRDTARAGSLWLATALRDNRHAIVIGTRPMGSVLVESTVEIPGRDDQRLKLATARLLRGDRSRISTATFVDENSLLRQLQVIDGSEQPAWIKSALKVFRDPAAWEKLLETQTKQDRAGSDGRSIVERESS